MQSTHGLVTADRLRTAIATGQVFPAFQPVVSLKDRSVSSFEVLARWIDPDLGNIAPDTFIPIGEEAGLLDALLHAQIVSACSSARQWSGEFRLAFNVSPRQFRGHGLLDLVKGAAAEANFPLSRIQIEITESAVLDDTPDALVLIRKMKELGIRIILDDFGIGYSSLTRLQSLPFDKLKIDSSFVRSMERDRDNSKIVSAVIGLCQSLGMPVVAEGVETEQLAHMLERLGCDYAQGYHFGRPMPAADVPDLLPSFRHDHHPEIHPLDLSYNQRLAQLRAIYHGVPIGLCFVDRHHRVVSMNWRFGNLVRLDPDSARGKDFRSIISACCPYTDDDLDRALGGNSFAPRAFYRPDHPTVALSTIVAAQDEGGAVIGYTIALIDITEHRKMIAGWERERRFADLPCRSDRAPTPEPCRSPQI